MDTDLIAPDDDWLAPEDDWFTAPAPTETLYPLLQSDHGRYDPLYEYGIIWGAAAASWDTSKHVKVRPHRHDYRLLGTPGGELSNVGAAYACVQHWHTLTTDLVASMIGAPVRQTERALNVLASVGAIRRGTMVPSGIDGDSKLPSVWGIRSWPQRDRYLAALRPAVQLQITGATDPSYTTVSAAYHNTMAAELCLRLVEADGPIAAAFGPHHSQLSAITGRESDIGFADAMLVGDNGARFAIEMQTSQAADATSLRRRAQAVSNASFSDMPLSVLYVGVNRQPALDISIRQSLKKQLRAVSMERLGAWSDEGLKRIFYVPWREWFSGAHQTTEAFANLTVERLIDGEQVRLGDIAGLSLPQTSKAVLKATELVFPVIGRGQTHDVVYATDSHLRSPEANLARWTKSRRWKTIIDLPEEIRLAGRQ